MTTKILAFQLNNMVCAKYSKNASAFVTWQPLAHNSSISIWIQVQDFTLGTHKNSSLHEESWMDKDF
jgi:hypothetical protein